MYINEEIEQLHQLIASPPDAAANGMFSRLYAWGILSLFNRVNNELETFSEQFDTSIDLDVIGINFEKYCDIDFWTPYWSKPPQKYWPSENHQTAINRMTDYLPNGEEGYLVTPEVLDSFKIAMHQLCDEDRMSARALGYALDKSIDTLQKLLYELNNKVLNPKPHLYEKLWSTLCDTYYEYEPVEKYQTWYQEAGAPTLDDLKAKQKQEIYELLKSGFFRFAQKPTGGEVKRRKWKIGEDDLVVGSVVDNDFEAECSKFDRYIEWKENCILSINYERLGQYIYKNYQKFDEEELIYITDFDVTLDLIHDDMAKLKPGLAKHLKRYQEHQDEALLNDCKKVFEPFKNYLKEELRESLIEEYLEKLIFDSELKEEAKKMLSGGSKKTYCTSIVIALSFCNIFKPQYNNSKEDLSRALNKGLEWHNKETFKDYLDNKDYNRKNLNSWTSNIMDDLKEHPFSRSQSG